MKFHPTSSLKISGKCVEMWNSSDFFTRNRGEIWGEIEITLFVFSSFVDLQLHLSPSYNRNSQFTFHIADEIISFGSERRKNFLAQISIITTTAHRKHRDTKRRKKSMRRANVALVLVVGFLLLQDEARRKLMEVVENTSSIFFTWHKIIRYRQAH